MKTIIGILLGMVLIYGFQFVRAVQFQDLFSDPVPTERCAVWRDNVYWSWESYTFEADWVCSHPLPTH